MWALTGRRSERMLHRTQMANGFNAASFRWLAASCVYRNSQLELSQRVQRWHDDLAGNFSPR
jgi:hypothetical protein